jgi:excisionase family DNA binding protein
MLIASPIDDNQHLHGKGPATVVLLTPGQVATRLQVSSAWVRDHATRKSPRIAVVRVGKLLRFRPEDVDQFIRRQCE